MTCIIVAFQVVYMSRTKILNAATTVLMYDYGSVKKKYNVQVIVN